LRENITLLEKSMDNVRNGRIGDITFAKKLSTSIDSVRELVRKAENSTGVETKLYNELQSLNQTLDHMEKVLQVDVTSGVTSLEGVVTNASQERNMTEDLIQLTRTMVNQGYSLLNSSISMIISQAVATEGYLAGLVPRFGAYANETSSISAKQNKTGQDIVQKTLSTEGLVQDAGSISLATVSDHTMNSEVIKKLKLETEAVKELGVKTNSSAYAVFAKSSAVLSSAQIALAAVNALNPNNSIELQQILTTTSIIADNATKAVRTVEDLNQRYSTLILSVEKAVHDTSVLMSRVASMDEGATAMLTEARRAETEAQSAVNSAAQTHKDAKEMLDILQVFATTANESQRLAASALEQSKEANKTSMDAIEYSQKMNVSIQKALRIATEGLAMAKQAQNLATKENEVRKNVKH
jgi:hypothetical protein